MIRVSDNGAAATVYGLLGSARVERLAKAAGIRFFEGIRRSHRPPAGYRYGIVTAAGIARRLLTRPCRATVARGPRPSARR
jgi:hypothetical protein